MVPLRLSSSPAVQPILSVPTLALQHQESNHGMALRIFIQFRTDRITGKPEQRAVIVANAACLKVLGRDFDFQKDFLHAQGEILKDMAPCHVLLDCDYHDYQSDLNKADLRCYRVVEGESGL